MDAHKARILVVDDEPSVLFTMTSILRQEGYEVEGLSDGAAALRAIGERYYDLVLTDLNMPGVDGLAVLAGVRKRSPNTVTVMITGYGSVDSALEAIQLGAYEYLLKPTEVAELKLAVKRSLERKRLSEIDTLYRLSRTITSSLDTNTIAAQVSQAARDVLGVAGATLMAFDGNRAAAGSPGTTHAMLEDSELRARLAEGAVVTANDAPQCARAWAQAAGVHSYAIVPGIANRQLACVLVADNGAQPYDFHASAQRFLLGLASQSALAVANASLIAELQRNNEEITAANCKLRELDALKSKFLGVATHELRTPLSIILGYNSMLAESLQNRLREDEKDTLQASVAACKRLIRLVNSMLDINQIQAGKMQMNLAREDLRPLVDGVITLFQHEARRRHLHLVAELPTRLPRLMIDAERIQQVLINLIGNAMKFTQPGGSVKVSVRERRDRQAVEIAVGDTGVGISPQDHELIFDEFAQIRRQNDRRHREGSGLGLAIARRIVQAHEGSIEVTSSPGKGSTFTVTLPLRARQVSAIIAVSA